ncbi:hypothetical protein [Amycolatopsis sp. cmx-11-32]|uniref:hypothetical protein n=1 Tax=Amycolatopsis sp. cmx-11-32 TaxID=2785796 RepID=UPI0039E40245
MMINDFTEMLALVRAATTDSLAEQSDRIAQAGHDQGLRVVPARLDLDRVVELDPALLTADQVVGIAAAADSHLLYLRRVVLDEDKVNTVLENIDAGAERTRVSKALARITGWTSLIEVGFAHRGVLHVWEQAALWHDTLDEFTTLSRRSPRWEPEPRDHGGFDEEKITELAGQVAVSLEFRRARWVTRRSVAEQLPALAELRKDPDNSWVVSSVVSRANELLQALAAERLEVLQARRDELVAQLADHSEFGAIRTMEARLKFTQDWIREHTDGLAMETWWLKELASLAVQARKKNRSTQLAL